MTTPVSPIYTTPKGQDYVVFVEPKTGNPSGAWCISCSKDVPLTRKRSINGIPQVQFGLHECGVV